MKKIDKVADAKFVVKHIFFLDGTPEDFDADVLINVLKVADDLYFNEQASIIDDAQYDYLKQMAERLDPDNTYFIGVGSDVRGGKVKLPHSMGSLTQSYEGDVEKWVEKYKLYTEKVCISDKMDGVSALALYNGRNFHIAYSRGNGTEGADISRHFRKMKNVPTNVTTTIIEAVRGEVIISESNFQTICAKGLKSRSGDTYKNARNAIAGIMNASSNPDWVYDYIDFVAYEVVNPNYWSKDVQFENLKNNGFQTAPAFVVDGRRLNDSTLVDIITARREATEYAIDGIVLEVNDADMRRKINPTKDTLNPEFARKYKVASDDNSAVVTVMGVHWNVSKSGYLKPRIEIEPVELMGVTITYATGFNAKFIIENKVGPGATVRITRSGDVIPFVQEVIQPSDAYAHESFAGAMLDKFGRWDWTDTMVDAFLLDDHPDIAIERAKDFFATIDAPVLREGNINKLFEAGFDTPSKIIKATKNEMVSALGENGKKAYDGLREKLTDIPVYTLMAATGEFGRGVGVRKLKALYNAAKGDIAKFANKQFICGVEGFEEKTAARILNGKDRWNAFFTDVIDYVTPAPYVEKTSVGGSMMNQFVVFTGFRNSELEQQVVDQGGTMQSGVSKKTTIVVAADPHENSTKLKKARDAGIKIMSLVEFTDLM